MRGKVEKREGDQEEEGKDGSREKRRKVEKRDRIKRGQWR